MKVGELFAKLGLEIDQGSFTAGERALEGVKRALEALAVVEGLNKLKEMIEATSEAADAAVKMGDKLGISAEAVQEMGYVAQLSDVSMGALSASFTKLERRLDQVSQKGKGPAADALKRLGISMKELSDLPVDKKLERIADGFAQLPASVSKVPLAAQLGLGPNLIPMLKDGGEGIRELREEARMLGLVIDTETAKSFEEWNDDMSRVKGAATGLRNDAVVALLPQLRQLTTQLFEWIKANRELVKQRLETVMRAVVDAVTGLVRVIGKAYEIFEKVAPAINDVVGALANLLGIADDAGSTMEVIAIAVGAAWVIANLPLLLMLGLVAAAILLIDDVWSGLNGGDSATKELLDAFEANLGETGVGRVLLGIKAGAVAVFDYLEDKVSWLIHAGERLGKLFFELTHGGDTKDQLARANGTDDFLSGVMKHYGAVTTDDGIDKVVQASGDAPVIRQQAPIRLSGVDRIVTGQTTDNPAALSHQAFNTALDWFDGGALFNPPAPAVNVAAPQMNIVIHAAVGDDGPAEMIDAIQDFYDKSMRDAVVSNGGGGNRLP